MTKACDATHGVGSAARAAMTRPSARPVMGTAALYPGGRPGGPSRLLRAKETGADAGDVSTLEG
jgi:hypothetical protein